MTMKNHTKTYFDFTFISNLEKVKTYTLFIHRPIDQIFTYHYKNNLLLYKIKVDFCTSALKRRAHSRNPGESLLCVRCGFSTF